MSKGKKYDKGKAALDLIPWEALEGMGTVLEFGKSKYGRANWAKGIEYSRLIAATLRHIYKFSSGQDLDDESGLSHLDHAATNIAMLKWMSKNRTDLDDRWTNGIEQKGGTLEKSKRKARQIKRSSR
jgi:hypothetical protein